ncbi:MAG: glycerol-3-phosphate 1-O-acyltransferase PlsY [Rhodospirillales bacterium]
MMNILTLDPASAALWAALGYLLGSVPFGLVLTRMAGLGDIREMGSGNIGATNVLRAAGKPLAAATLILDTGKGAAAALAAMWLADSAAGMLTGFAAVLGHNFPVWLRFKGGKGVASTFGVLVICVWPAGLAALAVWALTAAVFRMSSLASIISLVSAPVFALVLPGVPDPLSAALLAGALAVLSLIRHHANIKRILRGEESKIGKSK